MYMYLGRAYICEDPAGVGKMLQYLSQSRGLDKNHYAIDHVFEEHLLGCLQKLSLRRPLQTVMIEGECCAIGWKINQIFYYTRCITPKRVTSLRDVSPRCNVRQHSSFGRSVSAVACIGDTVPVRDLNLIPSVPETNKLSLDQLAGWLKKMFNFLY